MNADENPPADTLRDEALYGSWLIQAAKGYVIDADGTRTDNESTQEGVLIFTPDHRMIAFSVHPGRKPANSDQEKLKLFGSAVTYTGRFTLDQGKYTVHVDWSSTALNQNQPEMRYYTVDGDKLEINVPLHPSIFDPTKKNSNTLTLKREK